MRLITTIAVFILSACISHGGDDPVVAPQDQSPPEPVLEASTNDLVRILSSATNLPYITITSATNLYAQYTVLLNPKGHLKAHFDLVSYFSTDYELVSKLAEALVACPIKVRKQPDGSYLYTNKKNQTSRIQVIHDECDTNHFTGVYYITGTRFFASQKMLLHLESRPDIKGGIEYAARIYANSDSFFVNLVARIPFVKSYITDAVNTVVVKFDDMYDDMIRDLQENMPELATFRDPAKIIYFSDDEMKIVDKFVARLVAQQKQTQDKNGSSTISP